MFRIMYIKKRRKAFFYALRHGQAQMKMIEYILYIRLQREKLGGNAMNLKKKALIACMSAALAASILLVVLPVSGNLLVAYLSCVSAAAMLLAGAFAVANRRIPGGRRRLKKIAWFLPASVGISIIVLVLQATGALVLPYEMQVILQLIPLSIGAVKLLGIGEAKAPKPQAEKEQPAAEEAAETEAAPAETAEEAPEAAAAEESEAE